MSETGGKLVRLIIGQIDGSWTRIHEDYNM
jgi:hypothetical protein